MEKFIPYEKLSKKKKREQDVRRRSVWAISPVTRKPKSSKAYDRRKAQKWKDDSGFCAFLCLIQGPGAQRPRPARPAPPRGR